ncbi:MAG: hypothetical protein Q9157_003244 [Trypethelium eluteriae]
METTYGRHVQSPTLLHSPSKAFLRFTELGGFQFLSNKEDMASTIFINTEIIPPLADRHPNLPNPKGISAKSGGTRLERGLSDLKSFQIDEDHLQASPYADYQNFLDLRGLSTPNRLLALALTFLEPIRSDYATAPYLESFNWHIVFHMLRQMRRDANFEWQEQEFYVVIFRSKLKQDVDRKRLGELDQHSHAEACASGGLLKYWFGKTDGRNRNLATCIWRNREDARIGGRGPWHAQARQAAKEMYESIDFSMHKLVVEDGAINWRLDD